MTTEHQVYGRSFAVVIGITDYQNGGVPRLAGAERDAARVRDLLRRHGFSVATLLGAEATRTRLRQELSEALPSRLGDNDRALVYFAGHGQTSSDGAVGYFLPVDADPQHPQTTAIAMEEMERWVARTYAAKHVLFVADACYSGLALRTRAIPILSNSQEYIAQITHGRVRQSIVAGTAGQVAYETDAGGVFTDFVIHGIDGSADSNADGLVTGQELFTYVQPLVVSSVAERWGGEQLPQFARAGTGEFVFFPGRLPASREDQTQASPAQMRDDAQTTNPAEISRIRAMALAAPPVCHTPSRDRANQLLEQFGAWRMDLGRPATGDELQATLRSQMDAAAERVAQVQQALDTARSTGNTDPRCTSALIDSEIGMARAIEFSIRGVLEADIPIPTTLRRAWRQLDRYDREGVEQQFEEVVRNSLAGLVRPLECHAIVRYLRAARSARAVLAQGAEVAVDRLNAYGAERIGECVATEQGRGIAIAPLRPEELHTACGLLMPTRPTAWLRVPMPSPRDLADPFQLPVERATYDLALSYYAAGQLTRALGIVDQLPSSPQTLVIGGFLAYQTGAAADAQRRFTEALRLQLGYRHALVGQALLSLDLGSREQALTQVMAVLANAQEWDPATLDALLIGGIVLQGEGRGAEALALWNAAAAHGRAFGAAALVAAAAIEAGVVSAADQQDATLATTTEAPLLALRSRIACSTGAYQEADALARRAIALDPSLPHSQAALSLVARRRASTTQRDHFTAADLGAVLNHLYDARSALLAYRSLTSGDPVVAALLAELERSISRTLRAQEEAQREAHDEAQGAGQQESPIDEEWY